MGLAFEGIEDQIQDLPTRPTNAPKAEAYTVTKDIATQEESKFISSKSINTELEKQRATELISKIDDSLGNTMDLQQAMSLLDNHGSQAIRDSAHVASSILSRSTTSFASAKKSGNKEATDIAGQLLTLRKVADDIAPSDKELGLKKFMGLIPGKSKLDKFIQRRENAESQLKAIDEGLVEGQRELLLDNADLKTSRKNMVASMQEIAKERRILDEGAELVKQKVAEYARAGEQEKSNSLKAEVLSALEKRRMDLSTQFAVSMQAVMTVQIIEDSNKELIEGIDTARNVTMVALKNAVVVAQALENQRRNIEAVETIRDTTNNVLSSNAEKLKTQVEAIKKINSSSGVSVEVLKKSFDAIRETTDQIQRFKIESADSMSQVTDELDGQIRNASVYLQNSLEKKENGEPLTLGTGGEK